MHIHIAQVNGILFTGDGDALTAPGVEGEVTVLAHHVPLVTALKPGRLTVKRDGKDVFVHDVEKGVLEVTAETATVLL
jgi:F-type H+-transporting ATPase subunit epsilon